MERWSLAALHLLALGIGFAGIWSRRSALRGTLDAVGIGRVLAADNLWAIAAILWLATGLLRAFGGFEKGSAYYLGNALFVAKMAAFILIWILEVWPMVTFFRWRIAIGRHETPDTRHASTFAAISLAQTFLVLVMVIAATGMARGFGFGL